MNGQLVFPLVVECSRNLTRNLTCIRLLSWPEAARVFSTMLSSGTAVAAGRCFKGTSRTVPRPQLERSQTEFLVTGRLIPETLKGF
jgi:hypothetical protein